MNNQLEQEKNTVLDQLSLAYSSDKLSIDEYEAMVTRVTQATDLQTLGQLTNAFPLTTTVAQPMRSQGHSLQTYPAQKTSIAILSGTEMKGNFLAARNHQAIAVLGGVDIDLREAEIPPEGMTIQALALLGGVDIIAPPGVNVVTSGMGILGGFSSRDNKSHDPNAPTVRVQGIAILGGVEIRVKD